MPRVYVETSVISYLTARPSRDALVAACQKITVDWWAEERPKYGIVTSRLVVAEASVGDRTEATRRIAVLSGIEKLEITDDAKAFARDLLTQHVLPAKASEDALHLAIAVLNGSDFLLTWNCKHLANAIVSRKIEEICRRAGLNPIALCTPEQLREP